MRSWHGSRSDVLAEVYPQIGKADGMLTRRIYASRSGCILALVLLSLGEPCCAIFKRNDHCDTAPGAILGYAAGSSSSSRSDGEVHGSTAMHRNGRSLSAGNP